MGQARDSSSINISVHRVVSPRCVVPSPVDTYNDVMKAKDHKRGFMDRRVHQIIENKHLSGPSHQLDLMNKY